MSQNISSTYDFLTKVCKFELEWIKRDKSFKEKIWFDDEEKTETTQQPDMTLLTIEEGEDLVYTTPLFQINEMPEADLNCLIRYFVEKVHPIVSEFYYIGIYDNRLWLRRNVSLVKDLEENVSRYITIRDYFLDYRSTIDEQLQRILNHCSGKTPTS